LGKPTRVPKPVLELKAEEREGMSPHAAEVPMVSEPAFAYDEVGVAAYSL
jgi:hypothetical protein